MKDPYVFDFLELTQPYKEKDIEELERLEELENLVNNN